MTRKRTRAGTTEIADEQLVEIAELGPPPRARVVVFDEQAAQARAAIAELGHVCLGSGAGAVAQKRVIAMLQDEEPPSVIVLGLPGGEPIVDAARALAPRRPVLVGVVDGPAASAADRAHALGADLVVRRPLDTEHLGPALMAAAALAIDRARVTQTQGNEQMLRARLERRDDTATGFQTLEQWKRVLEVELKRARRYGYALAVCQLVMVPPEPAPPASVAHELHLRAAAAIRAAIRDIDFPVELTEDRFLVLLPYTELPGAEHVARRIVGATREMPGVKASGRSWAAAVAAGVAGVTAGAPVSMAQLMRDAGEALRTARRRGIDVVVAS